MIPMKNKLIRFIVLSAASLLLEGALAAADQSALKEPAKTVYDHYLMIQTELAKDSLKGLDEHAGAIAKAVLSDDTKALTPEIAAQAETLAKARDLKAARESFKPLSNSLIKYLSDHKVAKGTYYDAYCPMVKASWLQAGKNIANTYMGKEMLTCGEINK